MRARANLFNRVVLQMGKLDFAVSDEYREWMWLHKSRNAPVTHHKMAKLLDFFLTVRSRMGNNNAQHAHASFHSNRAAFVCSSYMRE